MNDAATNIVIFNRDLRLRDNAAVKAAQSAKVAPVFILDPYLLGKWSQAEFRLRFLDGALQALSQDIQDRGGKLHMPSGEPAAVLDQILSTHRIACVHTSRDYSPYANRRAAALAKVCKRRGVGFEQHPGQLLHPPGAVLKSDGTPYTVFTPYYRSAAKLPVARPAQLQWMQFANLRGFATTVPATLTANGHTTPALEPRKAMRHLRNLNDYETSRDMLAMDGTSVLSAHLRFGTLSVGQVYHRAVKNMEEPGPFLRQLHWRDFHHHIAHHFPHVYHSAFKGIHNRVKWDDNPALLDKWCKGETGFPIVDAGMRELAQTGYMHNRARMITASFLTKNLHIHWRQGERHFARYLIDYDPAVNAGNWQWCASTGCDAQPYFRVFNPWRQQSKFDPDCEYIKRWVPELRAWSAADIHRLEKHPDGYLPQIADLRSSAEESKRRFKLVAL